MSQLKKNITRKESVVYVNSGGVEFITEETALDSERKILAQHLARRFSTSIHRTSAEFVIRRILKTHDITPIHETVTGTHILRSEEIYAEALTEDNLEALSSWCGGSVYGTRSPRNLRAIDLVSMGIEQRCEMGQMIVKIGTVFTVFAPDIFDKLFIKA